MALQVKLYQHNKRINSTLKPNDENLCAEYNGVMVGGSSVLNPEISFRFEIPENSPTVYNYAYILLFGARYYYIDNWTFKDGLWTAHMSVDTLASYKEHIGNSVQYVLRSSSKRNVDITDTLYPTIRKVVSRKDNVELGEGSSWKVGGDLSKGHYIIGVINNDASAIGSVSYYIMNNGQMRVFLNKLMGSFSWLNVTEISQELTQALFNPFQYVVSCRWYPYPNPYEGAGGSVTNLPYGWWSLSGVSATRYNGASSLRVFEGRFTPPPHPLRGDDNFMNAAPFTECKLFAEPWGVFDIPCRTSRETLYMYSNIDFITGKSVLTVETVSGDVVAYRECFVGVDIQLSQMSTDVGNIITSTVGGITGTVKSVLTGQIGGAISNAVSGIGSFVESLTPELESRGLNGSTLAYNLAPFITTRFALRVDTDNERLGSPLAESCLISELSGYVLCASPSVKLSHAFPTEIETVNRFLAEGFFYE